MTDIVILLSDINFASVLNAHVCLLHLFYTMQMGGGRSQGNPGKCEDVHQRGRGEPEGIGY